MTVRRAARSSSTVACEAVGGRPGAVRRRAERLPRTARQRATATPGAGQVLDDRVDGDVRVAGWVHRRRDHGGLVFIDLRDRTGLVQLVFDPDELGRGVRARAPAARRGRAHASPGRSSAATPETVNAELPTGEFEVRVREAEPARRRRDAAVRDRGLLGRGRRGDAAALPLPRPAPRADGAGDHPPRTRSPPRSAASSATRASSRSRRRCSRARPPRAPATSSSPHAASRARSTRCRSRRSCSSSC